MPGIFRTMRDGRSVARRTILLVLLLVGLGGWASPASAHGVLERSVPPPNASLPAPPREVVLWFNEPFDPAFSAATVVDQSGKPVSKGFSASEDRRRMTVSLGDLPRGIYVVKWRALWSFDGHTTSGFFLFAVGEQAPTQAAGTGAPGRARVLVRWLAYAAALLLAGSHIFLLFVLRPSGGTWDMESALRPLAVLAGVTLLLSTAAEFALAALELFENPLPQLLSGGMLWPLLGGTKAGWGALLRIGAGALLLLPSAPNGRMAQAAGLIWVLLFAGAAALAGGPSALLSAGSHSLPLLLTISVYLLLIVLTVLVVPTILGESLPDLPWIPLLTSAALLAGFTVSSHASGNGIVAALADWIHLLAASALVGGWASFLLVLWHCAPRERVSAARLILPHLSTLFGVSVLVLVVTGLYATVLYLPDVQAFLTTPYGRLLLIKLLLVFAILLLGAANRYGLMPQVATLVSKDQVRALRRLLGSITAEVGIGALILLAVAALTITPPARVRGETKAPSQERPLVLAGLAGEFQVRLAVTPARPGQNRFEVTVLGPGGKPPPPEARTFLWVTKLDEALDPQRIPLSPQEPGRYVAEGGQLGLPGWWQVEAVVRLPGWPDASTTFPLPLGEAPLRATDPEAARLLEGATRVMAQFPSWREVQQITDGAGGVVVTWYEAQKPDRLRYRTSSGTEGIIIGSTRYLRTGSGPWQRDTLPQPLILQGPLQPYAQGAEGIVRGREVPCGEEMCQVVMWEAGSASFAAWIGQGSHRLHQLLMVAPAHYMTLHSVVPAAQIRIAPPGSP